MKRLEKSFGKNGLKYQMIERSDNVAIWKLTFSNVIVGYEVSRINVTPETIINGNIITERETIPSNEAFGTEGSKAFFPDDFDRALGYYNVLTESLKLREIMVPSINLSDDQD